MWVQGDGGTHVKSARFWVGVARSFLSKGQLSRDDETEFFVLQSRDTSGDHDLFDRSSGAHNQGTGRTRHGEVQFLTRFSVNCNCLLFYLATCVRSRLGEPCLGE